MSNKTHRVFEFRVACSSTNFLPLRRGVVDNAGVLALSKSEFGSERRINISVREKASCGSFLPYDLQVLPPMTLCISLNSDHRTHLINLGCMSENQG